MFFSLVALLGSVAGGGGPPAPTVASADPDVGDTTAAHAGVMTITGTGFVSGATVSIGGTAATSVVFVNATTITCKPPAKASGLHTIRVTNPDAQYGELVNGYRAWTPAEITGLSLYLDSRKVVVTAGSDVLSWGGLSAAGTTVTRNANGFATGVASLALTPSAYFDIGAWQSLPSGSSKFAVVKFTSADATWDAYEGNAPLTVVGDRSGSVNTAMGFSGGALEITQYDGAWQRAARSAGLNDGATRLVGWTHAVSGGAANAYVGETQVGSTASLTYNTVNNGYTSIGAGYSDGDGYDGELGAVVVVSGVISSTDRTRMHKWARLSFGAAA